ncbi:MAG: endonuclease III [Desulfobacteraceae bacterium]|nr:MAG: endonuclease III [Desulfobacteraceae bacterium]
MVKLSEKIPKILDTLSSRYPVVKTQLNHTSAFQLLIATILSAQCTDAQVNRVTAVLFDRFPTAPDLAGASLKDIKSIIFSTGFYNNKAKNIQACAQALLDQYQGEVPQDIDKLVRLPGVGRKTANVVLTSIFDAQAIVVDTHVQRISQRLGLTRKKDPVGIEFDLMKKLPEHTWSDFSLWLIYFGREICDARKPLCAECPLNQVCTYFIRSG